MNPREAIRRDAIRRDAIRRARIAFALLAALYLLAALVEPCDGHSCPPGERTNTSALPTD